MRQLHARFLVFAWLFAASMNAAAQAPGPAGSTLRGFSSQILITQLSLYLPEEATRGMNRGPGGRSGGPSTQAGLQGQGAGGAGRPAPMEFPRDPKLFLTKGQIARLLPILVALRDNPLPSPARAKQVRAEVDAVLTAAQKGEWADFQKKMQELVEQFRQRMGTNGPAGQGAAGGNGAAGGEGTAGREAAPGSGTPQATLLQRRQRQLDAFIKVLQDRLNLAGA